MLDLRLGVIDLNNAKQLKKVKQKLMSVAWHPTRWLDCCVAEDGKNWEEFLRIKCSNLPKVYTTDSF